MNYVTYDGNGSLTGAYLQELRPEHEGCSIIVTEAQRLNWTAYQANEARSGVEPIQEGAANV